MSATAAAGRATGLLVLACAAACSPPPDAGTAPEATPPAPPPDVLLVVLDTVRADHLSCYGYERPTTPAVDAFAERATRFTRAFSSAPWTLPSHASMFTGLEPLEHRVHTIVTESERVEARPLRPRFLTLAEGFGELGYRTGAFVANAAYLDRKYGLDQGFETYEVGNAPGILLNRRVFEWLAQDDGRPWFLFVNYMDAHRPYVRIPREHVVPEPVDRDGNRLLNRLIRQVLPGEGEVPEELAQRVIDQYDLGVASADEAFGRLLARVERGVDAAGTVVALTSDHGEYFGEHRLVEHSKDVYQPAVSIPLVIGVLGEPAGAVDDRPVSSADLPRLLLGASDAPAWRELAERFPHAPGARSPRILNAYARGKDYHHEEWGHRFRRVRNAIVDWPWKLIHSSDGAHELYHLERDAGEAENLYAARPDVAARLEARLGPLDAAGPVPDAEVPEASPEELERLRELGYVE